MDFDEKTVRQRIDIIEQNLTRLEEIRQSSWAEFRDD